VIAGDFHGHEAQVFEATSLLVFAVATASGALYALVGRAGTVLAIVGFVILGNPSSGAIVPLRFLPDFDRLIGPYLPNGAGYALIRNVVFFDPSTARGPIVVLGAYAAAGAVVMLVLGLWRARAVGRRGVVTVPTAG
jgi:hypothetical protein